MSGRHLTLAEIAAVAGLPQDDPQRRHMATCARCRALGVRHEQFLSEPVHVPRADLRDAEAHLAAFLAAEIAPADAKSRPAAREAVHHERAWMRGPSAWFGATALAAAAAVLVVGGVWLARNPDGFGRGASGVLRGWTREGSVGVLGRMAPALLADGRIELRWHRVADADRYEVSLYSAELRALAVVGTSRETVLVLAPGSVTGAAAGDTLLWKVAAFRGEARLAGSSPGFVLLP